MDISRFKYLVNVSCFLEVTELSVDTGRCYWDPLNAYVEFPEVDEAELETLAEMLVNDDTLFTIPGCEELFDLKSVCGIEDAPYWIRLQSIGNSIKDAVGLKEITSWEEYDELHAKIAAKRNNDGTVTFSVPTLQGLRIREDAVPVFVSHGDEPGERGDQGGVDDILVLTDKVDVLREGPFRYYTKEIELKCNDKFGSFIEYWQSLPVPRKIIFRMEKDSQDVYMIESLRSECGRGFITAQFIGNMCNLNPLSIEDEVKKSMSRLVLGYNSPLEREKELISKLQPGMLTYTDVAADGSKDGNVFTLCRCGRGNGKPIFDPSNPEHRSIIMQGLREMMMPIEDKYPQLHRARLNKPKSI